MGLRSICLQILSEKWFCYKNITKIARLFLGTTGIDGSNYKDQIYLHLYKLSFTNNEYPFQKLCILFLLMLLSVQVNPFNAEVTFIQRTKKQRFLKTILTLSCWYSFYIALAEYSQISTHLPGFQSFFKFFASLCIGQISHQQHKC